MGWLDNVIATVSPRRAYEREMWRQGTPANSSRHFCTASDVEA